MAGQPVMNVCNPYILPGTLMFLAGVGMVIAAGVTRIHPLYAGFGLIVVGIVYCNVIGAKYRHKLEAWNRTQRHVMVMRRNSRNRDTTAQSSTVVTVTQTNEQDSTAGFRSVSSPIVHTWDWTSQTPGPRAPGTEDGSPGVPTYALRDLPPSYPGPPEGGSEGVTNQGFSAVEDGRGGEGSQGPPLESPPINRLTNNSTPEGLPPSYESLYVNNKA